MRILSHFLLFFSRNVRFFRTFFRDLALGSPESEKRGIFFAKRALVNAHSNENTTLTLGKKKAHRKNDAPNKPGWSVRGTIPGVAVTIRDGCHEQ